MGFDYGKEGMLGGTDIWKSGAVRFFRATHKMNRQGVCPAGKWINDRECSGSQFCGCRLLFGLHKKLGTTFVYVTHDQVEAMSMADDIVLMKDGYIVQQSSPRELYNNPNCVYAAQFIGTPQMNIVKDILPEGMQVGFRPEKVYLKEVEEEHVEISAKIATKEMLGSEIIYSLDSPAGKLMAKSDYEAEDESTLKLSIPVKNMYLFDKDGKRITLDDERRLMIHAGFAKLAGREV